MGIKPPNWLGDSVFSGFRERFCAERPGVSDERGAWDCEKISAQDAVSPTVGEADWLFYARGRSHVGFFQGPARSLSECGDSHCGFWRERDWESGTCRFWVLLDNSSEGIYEVYRRSFFSWDAWDTTGNAVDSESLPVRRIRYVPHTLVRGLLQHDWHTNGRMTNVNPIFCFNFTEWFGSGFCESFMA